MSPTILDGPQQIPDFDNQLESIKKKHDIAKERLQERRSQIEEEDVTVSIQKDYLNKSGLDQINDVDEDAVSNSPKSENTEKKKQAAGAWSSFTKFFKKEPTKSTTPMIKEEKYEESYEKKFETQSVKEMNDYSMILVTDPGELIEMGSVYEEFSARDGP